MKASILQQEFAKALAIASRFVSQRAQLPILANIVLKAEKARLIMEATNLEISLSTSIGAKIEETGEIAIPARTITDLVANLKTDQIEIKAKNEVLHIKTENFTGTIPGMNTSDFPQIQQKMSDKALILPISEFIQSLHQVLFSVSKDESRPFLTGVLFIFGEDSLVLVASDGFRLSQKKIAIPKNAFTGRLILPKSALNELTHLDTNDKLLFEMKKADNQAIFSFQDTIMGSRIIEGDFPNFEKIIPKAARVKVSLEKEDLASALKIASVIARDSANVVTFIANDEGVTINAKNPQTGMQTNSIPAQVTGGDVEILFNVRFLEEFLSIVKGKDVEIELNDSVSPGIFKDPTDASYLHLIMPIKQ